MANYIRHNPGKSDIPVYVSEVCARICGREDDAGKRHLAASKEIRNEAAEAASPRRKHDMTSSTKKRVAQIRHGQVPKGYRLTQCGVLPSDWTELSFGDIYAERNEPGNENLPLLMVSIHSGVSDGEVDEKQLPKKVKRIADKTQYKRATPGDLVFNMMRAWQGAIGTVRTGGMVSPAYIVSEPNDKVDPLFMDYYVKMERTIQYIHRQSYGVTDFRLRLYWDSFVAIPCVLPPLAEQRKIAKILATQDKVIELKEKRLVEKQRQKKYLAKQMFSGMKCVVPLSELALITMGQSPSSETYNTSFNGVPLIQGNADISNRKTFPRMYTTSPTKICSPGDILISVRAPVGTVARSTISACIGRGICSIRPKRMSDYIYEYLLYYEDKWGRVSQGSTFESISGDDIGKLLIPQHHEGDQVAKMLTFAGKEIDLLSQDIEQEKRKKKALMQLLLTGIVRVPIKGNKERTCQ